MPIVVQKFGGSSVADIGRLRAVAQRVVRTVELGHQVVVVVSAMGKTTDELIGLAREVTDSPPRRELDMLLSCGERVSMSLLAMAIHALGRDSISFTGSQSGIITDERHSGARILEVRPVRIHEELDRGRIVIVAGFQGVSRSKEITTLGRGGSDVTAVALAAALGAVYCEICSDVDGVLTADPRVVPEARRLDQLGYEEMQELALHGAKVLNAQAVEWARRASIVISAVATGEAGGGTRVGPARAIDRRATGVTGSKDLSRITFAGAAEQRGDLLATLAREGVAPRTATAGAAELLVTFGRADLPDWPSVRARLRERFGDALAVEDDLGSITVVGHGIGSDASLVADIVGLCRAAGAAVRGIEATSLRVTVLVDPDRVDELTRVLHGALLAGG